MEFLFQGLSQESLWLVVVFYDLLLVVILYKFFGKYGLYVAVVLGIVLGNLQGGKVSELIIFGSTYKVSMGAILYSGIYFATDVLNEKYGRQEANRAVMLGFFANIAVMITISITTKLTGGYCLFTVLLFSRINALAPSIPKVGAHRPIKMPTSLACCSLS